jgi:hypothetical protein
MRELMAAVIDTMSETEARAWLQKNANPGTDLYDISWYIWYSQIADRLRRMGVKVNRDLSFISTRVVLTYMGRSTVATVDHPDQERASITAMLRACAKLLQEAL